DDACDLPRQSPDGETGHVHDGAFAVEFFDGEAVIWDGAHEALHHLSASARVIWCAAREGAAPAEIVDRLAAATRRARADTASEVDDCLVDLAARDLLP